MSTSSIQFAVTPTRQWRAWLVLAMTAGWAFAVAVTARADEPRRPRSFAITGARLVPVSGAVIDEGTIVFEDGLITSIGRDVKIPSGAWVIPGHELTVYPGLIDALSSVGLPARAARGRAPPAGNQGQQPISAGPEDRPATTPWRLAAEMFNAADDHVKSWREAGFTSAVVAPMDGIFPGQASLINLAGERSGAMAVQPQSALIVNLEYSDGYRGFPASLLGHIAYVKQVFLDTQNYSASWAVYRDDPRGLERPAYDRTLEPLLSASTMHLPVLYPANLAKQIHRAIDVSEFLGFPLVVYGAHEGYAAAEFLARKKVQALVNMDWPEKEKNSDPEDEDALRILRLRDRAPGTPAAFEKAGVKFAFYSGEIKAAEQLLPKVRAAIERGLSPEAALRALTLSAAEIYHVDSQLGSLETGKIANLIVTEGDLFAEKPKIKMVFVDGRKYDIRPTPEPENAGGEAKEGTTP